MAISHVVTRHGDFVRSQTVPNPISANRSPIAAVLFDLDGTLYDQRRLRRRMALELAALPFRKPAQAPRVWRGLRAYRHAHEALRRGAPGSASAASFQLDHAADRAGLPPDLLGRIVHEWMLQRPLKHLRGCLAPGLPSLLAFLGGKGVPMGVLSDYPVEAKLQAMGISAAFSLTLCATDPGINALKPSPRGFLAAASRWGLSPSEVLVVGDRADVDAEGARAAGMPAVVVGRRPNGFDGDDVMFVSSLERLQRVLEG